MRRGTRVGQAYVAVTADGSGINEEIVDAVDESGKDIDDKGREHGDKYGEGFSDGFLNRMRDRVSKRLSTVMDGKTVGGRAGDDAGDSFVDRMTDKVRDLGDRLGNEISDRLASNPEGVRRGVDRAFSDEFADRVGQRFAHNFLDSLEARIGDGDSQIGAAVSRLMTGAVSGNGRRKDDGLGSIVGRLLGAGSRSNVLNAFGRTMGGIVSLTERAGKFVFGMVDGFKKAGDSASILQRIVGSLTGGAQASGLSGILTKFVAAGPMAVAAAGAVIVAFSVLASVAGALVGILTALVSTVASGLVGAVAVAAPLLGALAVAGGLVVAAFTSMTNAQKDYLNSAFQPLKAEMTGIGQIIMTQFTKPLYEGRSAIQVWSSNLQQALLPLAGVARSTAGAFAEAGNIITGSLSGPGFQRFFAALRTELPDIVTRLARALGGFFNGFAGMFAAIMPYVTQFAGYLAQVAERFSKWANSVKGQNSIVDFVGRALGSLKSLWGFLKQVGGLFSDVFFGATAQRAGNSIFDDMASAVGRMRNAINKAIRNGDLRRWFDDAIKFGGKMWQVIVSLYNVFLALYNSGVLDATGKAFQFMADTINMLSGFLGPLIDSIGWALPSALGAVLTPLNALYTAVKGVGDAVKWVLDLIGVANNAASGMSPFMQQMQQTTQTMVNNATNPIGPWAPGTPGNPMPYIPPMELPDLISSGNTALNNTYESMGGYMPDPTSGGSKPKPPKKHYEAGMVEAEWENPYQALVDSILQKAPRLREEIRKAYQSAKAELGKSLAEGNQSLVDTLIASGKSAVAAITDAAKSVDPTDVVSGLTQMMDDLINSASTAMTDARSRADQMLSDAQSSADSIISNAAQARDAAASALASASTPAEAKRAERELGAAIRNYDIAQRRARDIVNQARASADQLITNAQATGERMANARAILSSQTLLSQTNINDLISGYGSATATLADYAEARRIVLDRLASANEQLTAALALRDNYASQVTDSIKTFGALTTASAKTLNGVAQALTVGDITDNLRDRLTKIKAFQSNLQLLLAQGLSQAAYKQIVDAGVDGGSAYADALVNGGQGGVAEVNDLVKQIGDSANILGNTAANQMYQAGVDAAAGLVDGLNSLASELESAATALGNSIAQAIRDALGIASPSRVLIADMEHVGDGAVIGLDSQHGKVAAASGRLASAIAVSPEVAAYATRQGQSATLGDEVSGNDGTKFVWTGDFVTPTEDPEAVVHEVVNEIVGRLP